MSGFHTSELNSTGFASVIDNARMVITLKYKVPSSWITAASQSGLRKSCVATFQTR